MASDDVQRAVALIRSGQRAEARELLKDILIRDRNNAAAWAAMVQVAESRKEAIICLKQVLRLKPGDPWATRALAQLEGRAPPPPPPATPSPPPARTSPPPASPPSQPDSWREPASGAGLPPTEPFPSASAFPPSSRASVRRPEPAPSGREGWRESPAGRTAPRAAAPPEEEDIEAWRRPLVREGDEQTGSEQERPRQSSSMLLIVGGIIILLIALCAIGIGFLMLSSGGPSRFTLPGGFVLPGSGVGGAPYDGGDGLETTLVRSIRPGQSQSASIESLLEAHNWEFEGQAGQTVTIRVDGQAETDPRAKLIDPQGRVIASDDDGGGGWNALIIATLPADGVYTVRVDVFTPGTYTITLSQ